MFRFFCKVLEPTELKSLYVYYGVAQYHEAIPSKSIKYAEIAKRLRCQGLHSEPMRQYFCNFSAYSMFRRWCLMRLCDSIVEFQGT